MISRTSQKSEGGIAASVQWSAAAGGDSKPHYHILDGLRGVAALTVVCFHLFEAYATSHVDQIINHGYLAVDFFFVLSGFVVGYAYDDRWQRGLTVRGFMGRRLIRLHPMVVMGAVIGVATFGLQGCNAWDVTGVTTLALIVATLMSACLLPAPTWMEVRGLGEMYPLNGPSWSLFFEYIGNIAYALVLRRLSTRALAILTAVMGAGLAAFAIAGPLGDICVGFAMTPNDMSGGLLRLFFAFPAGLLMARIFRPTRRAKGAFWLGAALIVAVAAMPRLGGYDHLWMNGIYDTLCVVAIFPLIVWMGASGRTTDGFSTRVCNFLGDISYPLYMVHYPFIYIYYAWVKNEELTFVESLPGAAALVVGSVVLAWGCLKFYDMPVRQWLTRKMAGRKQSV